uniref:Uncharacterized protein n=1 Tax=Geospiza parvula TaxID=87175 RepID=A0A8C3N3H0_GEOPR
MDPGSARVFQGPPESQFGYRVLQWGSDGDKWLLVGAPWDGDGRGDIYRCPVGAPNASCAKGNLGAAVPWLSSSAGRLGMTLGEAKDGGLVACAPLWSQQCGTSVFSSGRCVRLDRQLQPVATVAPTAQRECPRWFGVSPLQVGVLQYGEHVVQEWALGQHPTAQSLLEAARNLTRQEGRETRTAMAIREACTESFSPARGGRPGAARLLLVLTDGESHDGDELPAALAECDRRNVTRYAIAVLGHYLRRQQDPEDFIREIKFIASDPDEKYFFNVTDEAALNDIVDALGDRIFSLEGTHGVNESAFELEMSQIGFSIHHLEDGILFGMVGAHDWEGGVLEERQRGRVVPARGAFREEFPLQLRNHAAYLGYSVSSLQLPGGQRLLVAGAPRFQHKGKVVLFQLDPAGAVTVAQALLGDQIGSYFGSEVLALDLEGDGDSELLLVAAPSYLGGQSWETGRVYVYRVGQERLSPAGSLLPEPRPQDSRFGSALGAVPNLSQDGRAGAVVGAPLEDGHRGALYVFHVAPGTLEPRCKQRIEAAALGWSLRYFGISVDGRTDMDGDGLVDVAVGAQGAAVVLRSRWILRVAAAVSVEPAAVSVTRRNCRRGGSGAVCLRARLCFRAQSRAPGAPPGMDVGESLRYNASLEERSPASRAAFDSGARRLLQRRVELPLGRQSCTRLPFHVLDTSDYLRPLSLSLTWALDAAASSVLDEASPTSLRKLIPFFKDCGDDDECVTDLVLKATTDIVGSRYPRPHILRKGRRRMLVQVELENRGENAYNASLWLQLPGNLHFSSLVLQEPSSVKLECSTLGGQPRRCSVGYPVFLSQAKVSFTLELEFSCSVLLDRAELTLRATSDSSEVTPQDNVVELSVPVRYEANVFLSSATNLPRYELHPRGTFSPGPEFSTTLKVQNLGCFPLQNLTLHMALPALGHRGAPILSVTKVLADNVSLGDTGGVPPVPLPPEPPLSPPCAPPGLLQAAPPPRGPPGGPGAPRGAAAHGEAGRAGWGLGGSPEHHGGPQNTTRVPKTPKGVPKTPLGSPKHHGGPQNSTGVPKTPRGSPKLPRGSPKHHKGPQSSTGVPKTPKGVPKTPRGSLKHHGGPQNTTRVPKTPRGSPKLQGVPKTPRGFQGNPQTPDGFRWVQRGPRNFGRVPKTPRGV